MYLRGKRYGQFKLRVTEGFFFLRTSKGTQSRFTFRFIFCKNRQKRPGFAVNNQHYQICHPETNVNDQGIMQTSLQTLLPLFGVFSFFEVEDLILFQIYFNAFEVFFTFYLSGLSCWSSTLRSLSLKLLCEQEHALSHCNLFLSSQNSKQSGPPGFWHSDHS